MDSSPTSSPSRSVMVLDDKLGHLPGAVRQAYDQFRQSADPADLDQATIAILQDFGTRASLQPIAEYPRNTGLIEGLGFDSLAITEIVFYAEDLFQISISNDEIVRVRTIQDLCLFVRQKVGVKTSG